MSIWYLTPSQTKILDSSKRKEFADDMYEFYEHSRKSSKREPHPGGSVVSVSDSRPGGCEFDLRLRRLFFPAYFRLSPLQKHVRKVVGGFGKKSCVSTGERKPGNTCASPTAMI